MKIKRYLCALLLLSLVLPTAARADGVTLFKRRNPQSEVFVELYRDELKTWEQVKDSDFKDGGERKTVYWQYPNSGQVKSVSKWGGTKELSASEPGGAESVPDEGEYRAPAPYDPCYVDDAGRVWGYVSYSAGHRLAWVCISDSSNEELPADPEVVAAVEKGTADMLWRERAPVIAGVGLTVAVTAVLIFVLFWEKKKWR